MVVTSGDPIGRFLHHADQRPDHPAVEYDGAVVTYGQLAARARTLAALCAVGPAPKVLIALPQGPDAYAAMIGTQLAGGCYIPVNVTSPDKKIVRIIDQVRPDVIMAAPALASQIGPACPTAKIIDPAGRHDVMPLAGNGQRGSDAYVIFTSGSTGMPKGVVIPTAALAHYIDWVADSGMMRADDRVSQFPNISFDLSVLDIYGALSAGATLVTPADTGDRLFPAAFIERTRISVWVSVPSVFGLAMSGRQATEEKLRSVRLFVYCGEPLLRTHLEAMFAARPNSRVLNLYGPTEATVSMTQVALDVGDYAAACAASVALGDAIPGMGLHLLGGDHSGEGEIVITGPQLAAGYWQDQPRTEAVFRTAQTNGQAVRGYFTGDWGERRAGHVFFKHRIDHQVKIRGYRIETGEIVARLAECGWPVSCVVKHDDVLIAVTEVADDAVFDPAALRARLYTELDSYAVPGSIRRINRMPRNDNHKVDEAAVRAWLRDGRV